MAGDDEAGKIGDNAGDGWQQKLASSLMAAGDALRRKGNLSAAVETHKRALAVREELAAADPDNITTQAEVAAGCCRVGDGLVWQGRFAEASPFYARALSISEKRLSVDPQNIEGRRDAAFVTLALGEADLDQGKLGSAQELLQSALLMREELARSHPENTVFVRKLAYAHCVLGELRVQQRRLDDAQDAYRAAVSLLEGLVRDAPGDGELWSVLADLHRRVAGLYWLRRQRPEAIGSCGLAVSMMQEVVKAAPDDAWAAEDLFCCYRTLGDVVVEDQTASLAALEVAHDVAQRIVTSDPGNLRGHACVAKAHRGLAGVLRFKGNDAEAMGHLAMARAIMVWLTKIDPLNLYWQADLAAVAGEIGEAYADARDATPARANYASSLQIYERLVAADPAVDCWREGLARAHARAARLEEHAGD